MSASQRSHASIRHPARSLRVGIVRAGAIVDQAHVDVDHPLSMGLSGVAQDGEPVRIVPTERGPFMMWGDGVTGKLGRHGQIRPIAEWSEVVDRRQGVLLQAGDRVRLKVKGGAVLLQGMPHAAVEPVDPECFRPLLVLREDLPFLSVLSMCASAALALVVVAAGIEPVDSQEYVEPPERLVQVLIRPPTPIVPKPEAEPPQSQVAQHTPQPVPKPEPAVDDAVNPDPVEPTAVADARVQRVERLTQRSAVLAGLDRLQEMLGDTDNEAALAESLARSTSPRAIAAKGGEPGLMAAMGGEGRDDATLAFPHSARGGGLGRTPSPKQKGIKAPALVVPSARLHIPKTLAIESSQDVMDVVRSRYARQLKQCYQRRLNVTPNLRGRVELSFDIEDGVVAFVAVSENQTGDEALAGCLEKRAGAWKFNADDAGSFVMPMVFEPG